MIVPGRRKRQAKKSGLRNVHFVSKTAKPEITHECNISGRSATNGTFLEDTAGKQVLKWKTSVKVRERGRGGLKQENRTKSMKGSQVDEPCPLSVGIRMGDPKSNCTVKGGASKRILMRST